MLSDIIEEFMDPMFSPESFELYKDIILFLEAGPNESIQEDIMALMLGPMEASLSDDGEENETGVNREVRADVPIKPEDMVRDQLVEYLTGTMIQCLRDFGITVNEDATAQSLFTLLVGVYSIDKYEDAATLIQIVSIDTDNVEKLTQVLEIITTESSDNLAILIDDVSDDLIRAIQRLSIERADSAYQDMEDADIKNYMMRIRAYREYMQSLGFENLKIYEYIPSIVLGSEFEAYLDSGVFNEIIENNNIEKLAMEMYGLALVSAQSTDPLGAIRDVADKFLSDTVRTVTLNAEAIRINGGYSKFLQEAMNRDKNGGIING